MTDFKYPASFESICGSGDTIVSYGGVKLIDPRKIVIHDNCIVQQHENGLKVTCPDKPNLEAEIESLKCCGNCSYAYSEGYGDNANIWLCGNPDGDPDCHREDVGIDPAYKCSEWRNRNSKGE